MPRPPTFGRFDVQLSAGQPADPTERKDGPFRMLVLADLGGRARPTEWRPVRVDRDNFDALPAKLGTSVRLPGFDLAFAELDDFRPERLWQRAEAFDHLRRLRDRLADPRTFRDAAAEMRGWSGGEDVPAAPPPPATGAELLERMIGGPLGPAESPGESDWNAFLRRTVAPHLAPATDPRQADLVRQVETAAAAMLRDLLHHPRFQAVEAAWRGLDLLVRRLDTDRTVHLYVLDLSKDELAADLLAGEDLSASKAVKLLVGGQPWSLVVGGYTFEPTAADADLLGRIGVIAGRAGFAFVAGASPRHVGCPSFGTTPDPDRWTAAPDADGAAAWVELRRLPEAVHLGLALPRLLMRAPYGRESTEVRGLDFDELAGAGHEALPWGNPAFAWACLIGEAAERGPGRVASALRFDLGDLPTAVVERDGDREAVPTAEAYLTNRAVEAIEAAGLAPLRSVKGEDRAEFGSLRSLAGRSLAGRW